MLSSALYGRIYDNSEASVPTRRKFNSCPAPLGFLVAVMFAVFRFLVTAMACSSWGGGARPRG